MLKRTAAIVISAAFISLAVAPDSLAFQRYRRAGYCAPTTTYYRSSAFRGVAGTRYYAQPYYYTPVRTYYAPVGTRYYGSRYYGTRYYGSRYYRDHSTRNLALTVVAPAAVGAGIGAIAGGGKGAGIGALVGGGGGALFYLLRHHGRRY